MKSRILFLVSLSMLLLFGLVSNAAAQDTTGDFAVVQAAADEYLSSGAAPVISADALWENLGDGDADNDPFILSVRKAEHYEIGHVPDAVNIPWREVAKAENLAQLPTDRNIVAYCYTGHTGQVATTILGVLGYDVSNLKYGMMGWTEDDEVLATARFGSDVQADYRVESAAASAGSSNPEPVALPTAGGSAFPWWLVCLLSGLSSFVAGLALRRRLAS
jgi:rhodanese-related sulfurtransferase